MEEQKYYWMSYIMRHKSDMKTFDVEHIVLDKHPALELELFKKESPDNKVGILSYKEISLEEYILWKRT